MKFTALLFLAAIPVTTVLVLAGMPALPTLAFTAAALLLAMASDDYGVRRHYGENRAVPATRRRALRARLPLAA